MGEIKLSGRGGTKVKIMSRVEVVSDSLNDNGDESYFMPRLSGFWFPPIGSGVVLFFHLWCSQEQKPDLRS